MIGTTEGFDRLNDVAQKVMQEAMKTGMFAILDSDLKIDEPQSTIQIDRDKTAGLGLKMSDVGAAMAGMLGGGYVNYFSLDGRSYKVIPQVLQRYRLNTAQLLDYHIQHFQRRLDPAIDRLRLWSPRRCRNRSITSSR